MELFRRLNGEGTTIIQVTHSVRRTPAYGKTRPSTWPTAGSGGLGGWRTVSLAQPRILVADDQPDVLEALRLLLKARRASASCTASSPAGRARPRSRPRTSTSS